jgi:hypothetical protein
MTENNTHDDIKQNTTNSGKQNATEAGLKMRGDKARIVYDGADVAIQAAYDEVMEWLYGDGACGEHHPYFNNRSARDAGGDWR